jgi:hypothetical protein
MARIAIRPAPFVKLEREGDRPARVADGRANPPRAEVEAKDTGHRSELSDERKSRSHLPHEGR